MGVSVRTSDPRLGSTGVTRYRAPGYPGRVRTFLSAVKQSDHHTLNIVQYNIQYSNTIAPGLKKRPRLFAHGFQSPLLRREFAVHRQRVLAASQTTDRSGTYTRLRERYRYE